MTKTSLQRITIDTRRAMDLWLQLLQSRNEEHHTDISGTASYIDLDLRSRCVVNVARFRILYEDRQGFAPLSAASVQGIADDRCYSGHFMKTDRRCGLKSRLNPSFDIPG
ncbi:uncharacterized protein LOC144360325 [Saccoglossus kowalevskii]